jgi:hypothetical protein
MTFDEWFYEQEGFALRAERFYDDLECVYSSNTDRAIIMVGWLKSAYEEGYNQSRYDTMKLYWDDGK